MLPLRWWCRLMRTSLQWRWTLLQTGTALPALQASAQVFLLP
jgi:hypothetical protein